PAGASEISVKPRNSAIIRASWGQAGTRETAGARERGGTDVETQALSGSGPDSKGPLAVLLREAPSGRERSLGNGGRGQDRLLASDGELGGRGATAHPISRQFPSPPVSASRARDVSAVSRRGGRG